MCNLNSPTRDQICAPGSGRPSLNRWATREVLHGLPTLVSPFTSWFLDTQKSHRRGQPAVGTGQMSAEMPFRLQLGPVHGPPSAGRLGVFSHHGSLRVKIH